MAQNAANDLTWMMSVARERLDDLGSIRHWSNLKMGFDGDTVWVRDFTTAQIQSAAVKMMPFKSVYRLNGNKLFPEGSQLPARNEPALLWTPVDRGLPVTFPALNHHFFGIATKVPVQLVVSEHILPTYALLVSLDDLEMYIETAPAVRLQHLGWTILDSDFALVMGSPVLPVPGAAFYRSKDFLLPAGYTLEFPVLADILNKKVNTSGRNWVLWRADGTCSMIDKQQVKPLTTGAFRNSVNI